MDIHWKRLYVDYEKMPVNCSGSVCTRASIQQVLYIHLRLLEGKLIEQLDGLHTIATWNIVLGLLVRYSC